MAGLLDDFRLKNPAYKDVPDDKLADGLYRKFYADKMSRAEFDAKLPPTTADLSSGKSITDEATKGDVRQPWERMLNAPPRMEPNLSQRFTAWLTGPSTMEQSGHIQRQVDALYESKTGKKIGEDTMAYASFVATDPEAQKLKMSDPMNLSFAPGEGLMRSPVASGLDLRTAVPVSEPTMAQNAIKEGYVLPPKMAGDTRIKSEALEAWGGKYKLEQSASAKNQEITNRLAVESLGLPEGTMLTQQTFSKLRADAWNKYEAVSKTMPTFTVDQRFWNEVEKLGEERAKASTTFPKTLERPSVKDLRSKIEADFGTGAAFPTADGIQFVRQFRSDATLNIKSQDPGTRALGYAQRQIADSVDELLARNADRANLPPSLVEDYKNARQLIAKSHDVEDATSVSGDVSAHAIAALQAKGRPLSGHLKTIADIASSFPRATRFVSQFGGVEPWSVLDFAYAVAGITHGRPELLGAALGRPLARGAVLSRRYQQGSVLTGRGVAEPKPELTNPVQMLGRPGAILGLTGGPFAGIADQLSKQENQ